MGWINKNEWSLLEGQELMLERIRQGVLSMKSLESSYLLL